MKVILTKSKSKANRPRYPMHRFKEKFLLFIEQWKNDYYRDPTWVGFEVEVKSASAEIFGLVGWIGILLYFHLLWISFLCLYNRT